jgi:hypothetical protein
MIKIAFNIIVVFTNHFVNSFIVRQTILNSSNINKLNLRLMRASIYLSQFQLKIKYCSKKQHIISNVLSRLLAIFTIEANINALEALNIDIYHDEIENLEVPN